MGLRINVARAIRKLIQFGFWLVRRDPISRHNITFRPDLKRIGTKYGGWVIPTILLDPNSVCYCAGCGEDISFDLGLIDAFGCQVYGFDPTPRAIQYVRDHAKNCDKYHFSDTGLWDSENILKFYLPRNPEHVSCSILNLQKSENYFSAKVRRLKEVMRENGHARVDLLKLDIEGAEYRVIQSIIEDNLDIKILCVEYNEYFHPLDMDYLNRIRQSINSVLNYGFSLVFVEGAENYTFVKNEVRSDSGMCITAPRS